MLVLASEPVAHDHYHENDCGLQTVQPVVSQKVLKRIQVEDHPVSENDWLYVQGVVLDYDRRNALLYGE